MKMDGTNSAGRKVSLLNDHEPPQLVRLPSFTPSLRSRTSSYASSPIESPPTPHLVRSNSSDSTSMQTPSPITPEFSYDHGLDSPQFHQSSFFPPQHQHQHPKDMNTSYQQLPQGTVSLPYHPANLAQPGYYAPQPVLEQQQQPAAPPPARAERPPKKNQFPCPMAAKFGCNDHFTTSGHAARHAKKHTGKKDAFCPECNKAFTRKDNMEQHRRTHNTGRAKNNDREAKKAKHRAQRPKPSPLQSSTPVMSPAPMVDPSLPISPVGSYMAVSMPPSDAFGDFSLRTYPDPGAYAINPAYNSGPAPHYALDTLAMAASSREQ